MAARQLLNIARRPLTRPLFISPLPFLQVSTSKPHIRSRQTPRRAKHPPITSHRTLQAAVTLRVSAWCRSKHSRKSLASWGLEPSAFNALLQEFERIVLEESGNQRNPDQDSWSLSSFQDILSEDFDAGIDKILMSRFLAYAASHATTTSGLSVLNRIREITDMNHPAEWYPLARQIKRKIILHVGPTNSGKTYNALRALAGAKTGLYAGPLRLLAHEVWERLNSGSITAPAKDNGIDILDAAAAGDPDVSQSQGRPCNLRTGEELRIVSENAPLLSCTVEMVPLSTRFEVVVIDEIQMLADRERGAAWTAAVLGARADEVHLCGEATIVDLVRRMVENTGDELIVNTYERLSPLQVTESLQGDISKVTKGDCVVAFSRAKIFQLKERIEKVTGLRCAVAYGRLPPEVRSEQAQLFNSPTSGFDVIVASDAVGMGLNLKIKRVVFSALTKFNGKEIMPLSLSQVKQIAGRAGRFGAHGSGSIGEVTTLNPGELSQLKRAMASQNPVVTKATLEIPGERLVWLQNTLPAGASMFSIYSLLDHLIPINPDFALKSYGGTLAAADFVDKHASDILFIEKTALVAAPVIWKDPNAVQVFERYVSAYTQDLTVDIITCLHDFEGVQAMHLVKEVMKKGMLARPNPLHSSKTLGDLEFLHKSLIIYLWLSYRLPLAFSQQDQAFRMKQDVEECIDFILRALGTSKKARAIMPQVDASLVPSFTWKYKLSREPRGDQVPA